MSKKSKAATLKKRFLRGAAHFVMAMFILTAAAQPVRAQEVVIDPAEIAKNAAQYVLEIAQWVKQNLQAAAASVVNSAGQLLQTQANSEIADTSNTNARENVTVQTAENLAVDNTRPSYYSWCHVAQSSALMNVSETSGNALAQALTQGNQNCQADPSLNSQEILNECTLCFAPTAATDPEGSAYLALGCKPCADTTHVRQDRNLSAVLGLDQYPVDPAFQKPMANGTYAPMAAVTPNNGAISYYPFVAALTYCQHIVALQPPPPKAVADRPVIDLLSMPNYFTAQSEISTAASACFQAVTRRMQFGAGTTFPAGNPNQNANIVTRHDEQVALCVEDNAKNILDDSLLAQCQANGRSDLQAARDHAYKLEMAKYQANVLAVLPTATEATIVAMDEQEESRFEDRLQAERNGLIDAIEAAFKVGTSYTNPGLTSPT